MDDIIPDDDESDEEPPTSVQSFYEEHCYYFFPMAGWFLFSALLTSYNKWIFGEDHFNFKCPLLMTSIHFLAQWIFSEALCAAYPTEFGADRITRMSWPQWLAISVPCGMVTAGDVGLSNLSIRYISISFYTMIKASTPVFVLGWAYLFGIERITRSLILVVLIIFMGEFLTVMGETHFKLGGFLLCLTASVLSGARWTLVQLKLQSLEPPLKTTIATMKLLSPSMFKSLFFMSLLIERPWDKFHGMTFPEGVQILGFGLVGAFIAIAMILCEFYLIMHSSAIILMIGGVIKELVSIFVGVTFFGDRLNGINIVGFLIVFSGVALYKYTFHMKKQHALSHMPDRHQPLPIEDPDDLEDSLQAISSPRSLKGVELRTREGPVGYRDDISTIS